MSAIDRQLRNPKLHQLHKQLIQTVPEYIALCEAGSVSAGDPWVPDRSDRDLTIVVSSMAPSTVTGVQTLLANLQFNDLYLFYIVGQDKFLTTNSEQDLSMKFRGQTLFGPDVVAQKELPPRAFAANVARTGLSSMGHKFTTRLLNSGFWSENHLKEKLYPEQKRLFVFLAAWHYAKTGVYPRSRQDAVKAYDSSELNQLWQVLVTFDSATKAEVIAATMAALDWLNTQMPF